MLSRGCVRTMAVARPQVWKALETRKADETRRSVIRRHRGLPMLAVRTTCCSRTEAGRKMAYDQLTLALRVVDVVLDRSDQPDILRTLRRDKADPQLADPLA